MSSDKHQEQEEKTAQTTEQQRTPDTENIQPDDEITEKCNHLLSMISAPLGGDFSEPYTIVLLDPRGHSQILHDGAEPRELSENEIERLPVGPDPTTFSA